MKGKHHAGVPRGLDYLTTVRSDQYIEVPGTMLGPGMNDFSEWVVLVGIPLNPPVGNADTIMERTEDATFGKPVPTRLVAFANVSAAPIKLTGQGALAGYYDLYATLSPTKESPGETIYTTDHANGTEGAFESKASFWPLFELRPLGGGQSIFVDTGKVQIPGFPMALGSAGGRWSLEPPVKNAVRSFRGNSFFYKSEVIIEAKRSDQVAPMAMVGGGATIAKCAKIQAQFTGTKELGTLERVNFGVAKEFANLELD